MDVTAGKRPCHLGRAGCGDDEPFDRAELMASEERERVVADLWALPSTDGMTLDEWRHAAGAGERLPLPDGFRFEEVDAGGVEAEWAWWAGTATDGPVILFFHGGGWVVCSIGTHRVLGGRLAGAVGGRTLVVGYGLAPENPFPGRCRTARRRTAGCSTGASTLVASCWPATRPAATWSWRWPCC